MIVQDLPLAIIYPRLGQINPGREINPAKVKELIESISLAGLINPICVRPTSRFVSGIERNDVYEIVAGSHRYEAYCDMHRDTIPAQIITLDDVHAELAMIDENLMRAELTPAQEAAQISRRKELYEFLHPETKHGGDHKSQELSSRRFGDLKGHSKNKEMPADRFTQATAAATGRAERSLQKAARRGKNIDHGDLKKIEGTSLDRAEELDALIGLPVSERRDLIARAVKGEKVSAKKISPKKSERKATKKRKPSASALEAEDKAFADWLLEHAEPREIAQIVSWLEMKRNKQVVEIIRQRNDKND